MEQAAHLPIKVKSAFFSFFDIVFYFGFQLDVWVRVAGVMVVVVEGVMAVAERCRGFGGPRQQTNSYVKHSRGC